MHQIRNRGPQRPFTPRAAVPAPLLKLVDVAAILNVSKITVRRRVADSSLPHVRIKGRLYFKLEDIKRFIETQRVDVAI